MPSILVASGDATLRTETRRLLGMSTRLASAGIVEAGTVGEITSALKSNTLDVAIMDETLFGDASLPAVQGRTRQVVLSTRVRDSILRESGRTLVRYPMAMGRLLEEVERFLPGEVPVFDANSELERAYAALRRDYLDTLPERITSLRAALTLAKTGDKAAAEEARRIFHQVRGTGSSFGMPELTEAAAQGETALIALAADPNAAIWETAAAAADAMEAQAATSAA